MRQFNIKDHNKIDRYLRNLTERVMKDNIKISKHFYRNMPHLCLDMHDCSTSVNKKNLLEFLLESPKKVGMQIAAPPLVYRNQGLIPIKESHISVHSSKNHIFVDIFSCKPFNIGVATNYALDYFKPMTFQIELLYRNKN
jgi:S-adenosylmethionine decarboxylase